MPTVAELDALNYGGTHNTLPNRTPGQLDALSYSGAAAFEQGMTGADYAAIIAEFGTGQAFRYWKGFDAPPGTTGPNGEVWESNGRIYVEQDVTGKKIWAYNRTFTIQTQQWGPVEYGGLAFAVMPDDAQFGRLDRILMIGQEPERAIAGERFYASGNTTDELPLPYAASLQSVQWVDSGGVTHRAVIGTDVSLDTTLSPTNPRENLLHWLTSNKPATGVAIGVNYSAYPFYVMLMEQYRSGPMGTDGVRLPDRGGLVLERDDIVGR